MADGDAEGVLDGLDRARRARLPKAELILFWVESSAVGRHPRQGHVGVAGDGQRGGRARGRVDVDDLDGVAALAAGVGWLPNCWASAAVSPTRLSEPITSTL